MATPIRLTHIIHATKEDLSALRPITQAHGNQNDIVDLYLYWWTCQRNTIRDVLTEVYGLNVRLEMEQQHFSRWLISAQVDTWSGRSFRSRTGQSFLSHQQQQLEDFMRTRPGKPAYEVNVCAYLTVSVSANYNVLRIDMDPLPEDALGLRRNGPLDKLFTELQHLLKKYSFKEKVSILRTYQQQPKRYGFSNSELVAMVIALSCFVLGMVPKPLNVVILLLMAITFRNYLIHLIYDIVRDFFIGVKDDLLHPKPVNPNAL